MKGYCSVVTLHRPAFRIPISDLRTFVDQVEQSTGILSVNQQYVLNGKFVELEYLDPMEGKEIHIISNEIESAGYYIEIASKEYRVNILKPSEKTVNDLMYSIKSKFSKLGVSFRVSEYTLYYNSQKLSLNFPLSKIPSESVLDCVQGVTCTSFKTIKLFIKTLIGTTITLEVNAGIDIGALKDFVTEREGIPADQQRLLWKGKLLLENDYFLEEYDIFHQSTIHMMLRLPGGGGGPTVRFNECKNTVNFEFSNKAPRWRLVKEGISFLGTCGNSECEAFRQEALSNVGYGVYDVQATMKICFCPLCNSLLRNVQNCGFYKAKWTIIKKDMQGNISQTSGEANSDSYTTFKEGENAEYSYLRIQVTH